MPLDSKEFFGVEGLFDNLSKFGLLSVFLTSRSGLALPIQIRMRFFHTCDNPFLRYLTVF